MTADVIVVGAGLAGLVATAELTDAGKKVLLLDQEPETDLGGQAFWSFGGLFLVDSPEQRRMGVRDSHDLAMQDWLGSAGFDRDVDDPAGEDHWGRRWATAYLHFASGEKRSWLHAMGVRWFPVVGWAERGGGLADGHGNSVPRFHVTWGTGPGVVEPFERRVREAAERGLVEFRFRHRVDGLNVTDGVVDGVHGAVLEPSTVARGHASSRVEVGDFAFRAQAVIVASGGIGANHDLVRAHWPARLGSAPQEMISGVPEHVDGRMLAITSDAGGRLVNRDRMWHYTEGLRNWDPIWARHGIRILPGPSSLWFDARGCRFGAPNFPGFDTLSTLAAITATGYDHSWFVLTRKIIEKEFALSGSEQNPDLTGKDIAATLGRIRPGAPAPVEAFMRHGEDFVVADTLAELVARMNKLVPRSVHDGNLDTGEPLIDLAGLERQILARDREIDNPFAKDLQVTAIHGARRYRGDKLVRTAAPHKILDPRHGPLIAVRLNILTRKTLGGLQTDLSGRVLRADATPLPGLYAAGEVAGFGGGGMHGYRSLEGTFLGGCLAVTVELTPPQLDRIADRDDVAIVRLEKLDKVTTMRDSVEVIQVREAWEELGLSGRGVKVAVLDSGVDGNHPALLGKVVDEVSTAVEPVNLPGAHGTHVAGTIASNDAVFRGVAFQADIINIKVLTAAGFGQPQFVIDGLEQAVRRGALVANLSLGWSEIFHGWVCNDADCILCQAADNAVRLGVTVVVAAGNEGTAAGPGQSNIRHPGAARRVITVAAVDKAKQLASFSSVGPGSGRLSPVSPIRITKPDVAGPGVDIESCIPGGGFASFSGTSMASPHVAGLAALVLERTGPVRPSVVKKLLEDSCERLQLTPDQVGYGLVNAMGALIRNLPTKL